MQNVSPASIDATKLYKGQTIPAGLAWNHYIVRRPDTFQAWMDQYGDEEMVKAAKMAMVLQRVVEWLDRDRRQAELPPLVMTTAGGCINVLTDEKASTYLDGLAFSGLRRHSRATSRLVAAVDESKLSGAARREHQNRINVHSFIAASAQGAQAQLRRLRKLGKAAPRLEQG